MTEKKTVTFSEAVTVLDYTGTKVQSFEAGQTVSLPTPSAERWIRRGKAALATDGEKPAKGGKSAKGAAADSAPAAE